MLFVTFNDYPGGIYYSQVIDVIRYLNHLSGKRIKLVAFISFRNYFENRRKIKENYAYALVLPMFPGVRNWRLNRIWMFFLGLFFCKSSVICRGIFAFDIVWPFKKIGLFKYVIFDGRGAYKAEFEEYKVINDKRIIDSVSHLEREAVLNADYRIAVSNALVNYWKETFNYNSDKYIVIPCTLSTNFIREFPSEEEILEHKRKLGFEKEDIVLIFSGSSSGWHSLQQSDNLFLQLLEGNERIKILLLGHHQLNDYQAYKKYPDRVFQKYADSKDVWKYLLAGDYGWLVREQSITNKVASPVKFAEYLSAGLKVIISDNLGDYSEFCKLHQCGYVVNNGDLLKLSNVAYSEKQVIHQLAMHYFMKENYKNEYEKILAFI